MTSYKSKNYSGITPLIVGAKRMPPNGENFTHMHLCSHSTGVAVDFASPLHLQWPVPFQNSSSVSGLLALPKVIIAP